MSSCQYIRCITSFAVCEITTLLPNTILACKRATQSEKEQNRISEDNILDWASYITKMHIEEKVFGVALSCALPSYKMLLCFIQTPRVCNDLSTPVLSTYFHAMLLYIKWWNFVPLKFRIKMQIAKLYRPYNAEL